MGVKTAPVNASVIGPQTSATRFDTMDQWGTDMQALSINANWYAVDQNVAVKMIQVQNEALAALCARYPDRFVAFASVALQFPELAAQQLEAVLRAEHPRVDEPVVLDAGPALRRHRLRHGIEGSPRSAARQSSEE